MGTFLKLIRWKSILVATLVMFLMKYAIIIPVYRYYDVVPGLSDTGFFFLIMASMFILAGGNVINDYFDRKTDTINRPEKVLVGFTVNRRKAIFLHSAFTFLGVVFGVITAWFTGKIIVGLYFFFISLLIWIYSYNLKKKALAANITLSFLVALIPLTVGITEYYALEKSLSEWDINTARAIKMAFQTIIGFSIFTFLINLMRELIKDCQDFIGDYKTGIKSVPIVIGKKNTNFLISIISMLSIVYLVLMWEAYLSKLVFFQGDMIARIYIYCVLIAPLLVLSIRSVWGNKIIKYRRLNILTKFIMFFGVLFSIIFSFAIYGKI
ncbi:MAG: geranylgeranylglycerol-phosphate geranylgeranyltransferase [Bacteroidales bacterium]|nr:geranylgeranylglycerol-phosphate geranylgeranyltransferase [Bacteroidales bacterium]MDY0143002.1 geranylgeranylglycerol-phosphate geranylgeranyltransferase [Bacteroidales bacterium]